MHINVTKTDCYTHYIARIYQYDVTTSIHYWICSTTWKNDSNFNILAEKSNSGHFYSSVQYVHKLTVFKSKVHKRTNEDIHFWTKQLCNDYGIRHKRIDEPYQEIIKLALLAIRGSKLWENVPAFGCDNIKSIAKYLNN